MSFKHVKFEDSPIMRSLEKVAREKGLVKPEPSLQKTAALSKKADLTPTSNLMENIFKLCAGLREQGRVVEASEVETNYLYYKQAQTLYEAHKEKGEDLIQFAHPKGSHKLEGVAGNEATFEDILDRHAKILSVVEKRPTGKLSSATQILNSVKLVLGQQSPATSQRDALLEKARDSIRWIEKKSNDELTFSCSGYVDSIIALLARPSVYNLNESKHLANKLYKSLDPSFSGSTYGMGGLSDYTWAKAKEELSNFTELLDQAAVYQEKIDDAEDASRSHSGGPPAISGGPPPTGATTGPDTLTQQYSALADKIELYTARAKSMEDPNSAAMVAWLGKAAGLVKQYSEAYANDKFKSDPGVTQNYTTKLNGIQTKVETMAQKHIK